MTTTTSTDPLIVAFAEAVRTALDDLPRDEIDDLTDGLEADLTEQATDDGSLNLGDPVEYAAELRTAAGLPPRGEPTASLWSFEPVIAWWGRVRAGAARAIQSNPVLAALVGFLVVLRPVWWVLRGWAFFSAFRYASSTNPEASIAPSGLVEGAFFIALILVSVQWGRGQWKPWAWLRVTHVLASVIGLFLVVQLAVIFNAATQQQYYDDYVDPIGLNIDGTQITNIFAYGADGELITDVQLFDQDGNPISVLSPGNGQSFIEAYDADGEYYVLVPRDSAPGRSAWNVYPLQEGTLDESVWDVDPSAPTTDAPAPFERVQPLLSAPGLATPGPVVPTPEP
jgi:hypothetical protein